MRCSCLSGLACLGLEGNKPRNYKTATGGIREALRPLPEGTKAGGSVGFRGLGFSSRVGNL